MTIAPHSQADSTDTRAPWRVAYTIAPIPTKRGTGQPFAVVIESAPEGLSRADLTKTLRRILFRPRLRDTDYFAIRGALSPISSLFGREEENTVYLTRGIQLPDGSWTNVALYHDRYGS